jgi:hypothetical protein
VRVRGSSLKIDMVGPGNFDDDPSTRRARSEGKKSERSRAAVVS